MEDLVLQRREALACQDEPPLNDAARHEFRRSLFFDPIARCRVEPDNM
ncbi:hypothetical protein V1291_002136 [Nitrobacteraceae bacterium AZCC 1564]